MDIRKTKDYYKTLREDDLCDCDYCKGELIAGHGAPAGR